MADTDRGPTDASREHERGALPEGIPLGQRLFDNWPLLLVACIVVMFVFYTGWGLVEIFSLPQAPLP